MALIPYILGLISSIVTAVIFVLLNRLTGWEIHSLSILFVLPLGGLLLGLGGAAGFFLGRKFTNTKIVKADYVVAIILGLLTFFSINYISYRTTHITLDEFEEVQVVYSFSKPKDHVSISELTSFTEYMNMINSSSKHQFRYRGAVKLGDEFEVGKAVTTIMFYVQILGALVGSLALALIFADSKYCDKCKKYYKNKTLKSISLEGFENTVKEINENLKDGNKIKSTIENAKEKEGKKSKYIDIALSYCPNCYDGSLIFKFFAVNSKGEPSEVSDMRKEVSINQGVIMELVKK